jgi:hypothetical protein
VQTVATPHLGVRKYTFGIRYPAAMYPLAGLLFGRTGTELFLSDSSDSVGEPTDANGRSNGNSCCSDSNTAAATSTDAAASTDNTTATANATGSRAAATGADTATSSSSATVGKPLLVRMACDREFLEPLLAFKRRRVYANYRGDFMVTLRTAAIEPEPLQEVNFCITMFLCIIAFHEVVCTVHYV